ncbi:MAG: hypothetical protein NT016_03390 [Candidatus Aenigmarchaeota archaeon]|nr:hypothetical protein [Candidatus Aenigmarchaeota archaeon]
MERIDSTDQVFRNVYVKSLIIFVWTVAAGFIACYIYFLLVTAQNAGNAAVYACVTACRTALAEGADLSNGPCLSDSVISGWACDVAHSPRQAVDDLPANQCSAYGTSASHFVEVDTGCNLIRVV